MDSDEVRSSEGRQFQIVTSSRLHGAYSYEHSCLSLLHCLFELFFCYVCVQTSKWLKTVFRFITMLNERNGIWSWQYHRSQIIIIIG